MKVTVYSKPNCPKCKMTVKELERKNIPFEYVDMAEDDAAKEKVMAMGHREAPVVTADELHWSGFRPDMIVKVLHAIEKDEDKFTNASPSAISAVL